jgi:integrase
MQRERLTPDRIRRFTCPPESKQAFVFDTEAPRLAVRTTHAGAKSFIFEAKLNRQTIRITIGDVRAWNIDDARAEARRLQTLVDRGIDPRELAKEKAEAKTAEEAAKREADIRQRFTLKALCLAYVDHLKSKEKIKTARDAKSAFNVHVFKAWPNIAALPVKEVTANQIATIIRRVRESGKERTAGILRNYLTAAYNAARRAPFDSGMSSNLIEFGITSNPAEIVPTIPVNRGTRALSPEELQVYMEHLGDDGIGQALRVALLSGGQRMAQLLRAKTGDFDATTGTLRLWDGKGKRLIAREHLLPLGPKAKTIVKTLAKQQSRTNDPLFATSARLVGNRISEISKNMDGEPFDLRDIRRTCETMLAAIKVNKDTRAQLLSHGLSGVQNAHYDRHDYIDEKQNAMVIWERRLDKIATGRKSGNVVQLERKANR